MSIAGLDPANPETRRFANGTFVVCPRCSATMALNSCGGSTCIFGCGFVLSRSAESNESLMKYRLDLMAKYWSQKDVGVSSEEAGSQYLEARYACDCRWTWDDTVLIASDQSCSHPEETP